MKNFLLISISFMAMHSIAQNSFQQIKVPKGNFSFMPARHASIIFKINDKTVCIDPAGELDAFLKLDKIDFIVITDIHQDHFSPESINAIPADNALIIAPRAVYTKMNEKMQGRTTVLSNGEHSKIMGFDLEAIPMYNFPETDGAFHPKGRGNGYVFDLGGFRIYISGDTGDIPEMRSLKNIDIAFICMNVPYTMTVEKAAEAVAVFKPKIVYPYHYKNGDGSFGDVNIFADLIRENGVEAILLKWY